MARKDMLQARISWLKLVFGILIVTEFSLLGWIVLNYNVQPNTVLVLCAIAILALGIGIVTINYLAQEFINELEEV